MQQHATNLLIVATRGRQSDREKEREIEAIQPEKFVTCGRPCHAIYIVIDSP